MAKKMKKPKKGKRTTFKKKKITPRHKPKGKPPAALRSKKPNDHTAWSPDKKKKKKKRAPRAVAPPPREVGLLDAIGEVIAVCEALGQEMREWADNMPDNKQGGQKHSEVEQAADTLEEQAGNDPCDPEADSFLNDIKITIQDPTPRRQPRSRATQLGDATDILNDIITKLEEEIGDKTGPNEVRMGEYKDTLEEIESELQGVDFPGMYG